MKKRNYKLILSLATALVLATGCGNNKKEEKSEVKKTELKKVAPVFKGKENKYKADNTTEVLIDAEISKENIVKVVKHGDHWHVWTKDGVEHITYTDPNKLESGNKLSLVSVVSVDSLKNKDVVEILKHGDHWHVYTSDGNEYLTYENPESSFKNIKVGEYVGNHGDNNNYRTSKISNNVSNNTKSLDGAEVVRILQHEDHYHIYTRDGQEFITYSDPRSMYPNAEFGQYVGSHGDEDNFNNNYTVENTNTDSITLNPRPTSVNLRPASSDKIKDKRKDKINNKTKENKKKPNKKFTLISVENDKEKLKKLDVKEILLHGDHYHIYTKDGREIISYNKDIPNIFKSLKIGEYVGSHGDAPKMEESDWPKGIDRIVDHGDHWHLYRGNEEVTVVRENPKTIYPQAEYIVEDLNKNKNIIVSEEERFKYADVNARLIERVLPYLDKNLQAMTHFGDLTNAKYPVYGSNNVLKDVFYWLHGNHYHAITINQIIQNAKAGDYGDNTARDVVATLKYKVENPETNLEVTYDINPQDVQKFLMKAYDIENKIDVYNIGNTFDVYKNGQHLTFHLKDFAMKDGQVVYLKDLPEIKAPEKEDEKEGDKEEKDTPNLFKDHEYKGPNKEEIVENKDSEKEENPENKDVEKPISEVEKEENEEEQDSSISKEERQKMDANKEKENLQKLAKALSIDEGEAFDRLYELFDDLYEELGHYPSVKYIEVNDDGSIEYQGKTYNLKSID